MWYLNQRGEMEFKGGKNDWSRAAMVAEKCSNYKIDDEDELVSDTLRSCYNCRYRRWTENSIVCCKKI